MAKDKKTKTKEWKAIRTINEAVDYFGLASESVSLTNLKTKQAVGFDIPLFFVDPKGEKASVIPSVSDLIEAIGSDKALRAIKSVKRLPKEALASYLIVQGIETLHKRRVTAKEGKRKQEAAVAELALSDPTLLAAMAALPNGDAIIAMLQGKIAKPENVATIEVA